MGSRTAGGQVRSGGMGVVWLSGRETHAQGVWALEAEWAKLASNRAAAQGFASRLDRERSGPKGGRRMETQSASGPMDDSVAEGGIPKVARVSRRGSAPRGTALRAALILSSLAAIATGAAASPAAPGASSPAPEGRSAPVSDGKAGSPPEGLAAARARIDDIDRKLLALLSDRARIALEIAQIKRKSGLPIHNPRREAEVLATVAANNPGPLSEQSIRRIWERLFEEMRNLEGAQSVEPSRR